MTRPRSLIARLQHFVLADDALEMRQKNGWGLVWEKSNIRTFLDAVEDAHRNGIRVHHHRDYPTLSPIYARWLYKEGYLRPAE